MNRRRSRLHVKVDRGSSWSSFRLGLFFTLVLAWAGGYLWLNNLCIDIGARIQKTERLRDDMRKRAMIEECKWANLKSPRHIEILLRQHHLAMSWPREHQIVRLESRTPPPAWSQQFAARQAESTLLR